MHVWRVELPSNRAHLSSDKRSQYQMLPAKKQNVFLFFNFIFFAAFFLVIFSHFTFVTERRLDGKKTTRWLNVKIFT